MPESREAAVHEDTQDRCTVCGRKFPGRDLTIKQARFVSYSKPRKYLRSRTEAKLCPGCLQDDPHWNSEPKYYDPGE